MTRWVEEKREFFERDILQDFCRLCRDLHEQFARFAASGGVSFSVLHGLVGDFTNKGLLWRLKDNAHLVFRNGAEYIPAGHLLDWTLGYIYHEAVKLMEDAHLRQAYIPRLRGFAEEGRGCPETVLPEGLSSLQAWNRDSMERGVDRLKELLALTRKLFCRYFSGLAGHRPLARFLYDQESLARAAFQEDYPALIAEVYGNAPARLYAEAAHSLMDSARTEEAAVAVAASLARDPFDDAALAAKRRLEETRQPVG